MCLDCGVCVCVVGCDSESSLLPIVSQCRLFHNVGACSVSCSIAAHKATPEQAIMMRDFLSDLDQEVVNRLVAGRITLGEGNDILRALRRFICANHFDGVWIRFTLHLVLRMRWP